METAGELGLGSAALGPSESLEPAELGLGSVALGPSESVGAG